MRIFLLSRNTLLCTAHKYSTDTVIIASRLIDKFDHCHMELLCLSKSLYRTNINIFAFLAEIWQNLQ